MAELASTLTEVAADWALNVLGAFGRSSASLVFRVRWAEGTWAVLILGIPGVADPGCEACVCGLADGRDLPRVLADRADRDALLLEAFGRPIGDLD